MNLQGNLIYIENGKDSDIKNALSQWIELYIDRIDDDLKFKLYKFDRNNTVIELNKEIENEIFNFLVIYITYPENIEHKVIVNGFTTVKDGKLFPEDLINQSVQIFIPKNDSDFDVVLGVLKSGDTYKIDFGGKIVKIKNEKIYNEPIFDYKKCSSETIGINKKLILKKQDEKKIKKFNFRFLLISSIFILGTLIAGYLTSKTDNFVTVVKITSFGLFFWTMIEHNLLRVNSIYFKLLLLSIFLAVWGYYSSFENTNDVWLKSSRMSLYFLILSKILRYIYLLIYHREPEFDNTGKLIVDRIYFFILFFGTLFASMFI